MKIGIAGTGRMGTAIALRLLEMDHEITVWNRTPEKTAVAAAAGATVAPTPAALASACDRIITIPTKAAAMEPVYTGQVGLPSGNGRGKQLFEVTTVVR